LDQTGRDELLGGAAALLFPIRWPEPFGLVMPEALACGTPVLALRAGSVPEVIGDGVTGFICSDEDELAEVRWVSLAEADDLMQPYGMYEPVREYLERTLKQ